MDSDINAPTRVALGGLSGLIAQSATYPLDIVRRRMQVRFLFCRKKNSLFVYLLFVEGRFILRLIHRFVLPSKRLFVERAHDHC